MEYRTLDLTVESANGLKKARFFGRNDVYAVVSVFGDGCKLCQTFRTPIHRNGDSNPRWNFPMKFTVFDHSDGRQNRQLLTVNIKAVRMFGDKDLGIVHVPIKELLDGVGTEGKAMQNVSYRVVRMSGKRKGDLNLTYKIGEKFAGKAVEVKPATAYRPAKAVRSRSRYRPAAQRRDDNSLTGFGPGLLGGFVLSDIASQDAHGHTGGGGGGGGCGGGGGGGCGGGGGGGGGCGGSGGV